MKPKERDDLLIRLDERTDNILYMVKDHDKHLRGINGQISANMTQIAVNKSSVYRIWWFMGSSFLIISSGLAIALKVFGVF